ncbi:MAG: 16S rRNA (guanine(527)-N(7))-methyltransferase RsmG [Actinobacteria bacterium]|nr:16S rRNA (guanine(527)-N(7))-methyltransferase RsmG [Actinomycetota bacterium]
MFHVKHSAVEPEPESAPTLCGEALPALRSFAADIALYGEELGLVGPRELDRLWTRHILNSALLARLIGAGTLADVGSGAGFPGLVVAIMRPDVSCILIEPLGRRATWLEDESKRLGLGNVTVLNQRAEDTVGQAQYDYVTARAVSALKTLIPLVVPLVRPGGELVLMKGERVDQEIRDAASLLVSNGLQEPRVQITGPEYGTEETRVFRARVAEKA